MAEREAGGEEDSLTVAEAQLFEARAGLHLYLGQLSEAEEALEHNRSGVSQLVKCLSILEKLAPPDLEEGIQKDVSSMDEGGQSLRSAVKDTRRQLCGAHCSIAELYLTDLCYDPEAEAHCETSLKSALALDDGDGPPDSMQGMANLCLSQGRGTEAVRYILDAYSRIKVGCEAMADLVGLGKEGLDGNADDGDDKAKELVEVDAASSLPCFEFRCQTAKILLECAAALGEAASGEEPSKEIGQSSFCSEAAIQVLGSLLAENDEVVEVWYLLGCAFASLRPPNTDGAQHHWETALEMLLKVKESMDQEVGASSEMGEDDELGGELKEIAGQIEEVRDKLASLEKCMEGQVQTLDVSMEART